MGPAELAALVAGPPLDEATAIKVLRNPYCSGELAVTIAERHRPVLSSHVVRQLLSGIRDFPQARAMNLLATLPWLSLVQLAVTPQTPSRIRHQAEMRVLGRLPVMALGERVALARRSPRALFRPLIQLAEPRVLAALLDNPRMVENDVVLILATSRVGAEVCRAIHSHQRWGAYYGVRVALVECPATPLPVALAAMVRLRRSNLVAVSRHPKLAEAVRNAAKSLLGRDKQPIQRVI